ncbi:Peptidase M16 inactive domain protein [compost metagenome]
MLDNDHQATLDLLSRYLEWVLYDQLRLRNGLSYGPSAQRESFGDTGLLSLNADLEREDVDQAVEVMQALFDHLRKKGLDPDTFARIKYASVAKESWSTQGNSALADYYWGALNDYNNGRFANPVRKLRQVSLAQANEALKELLKEQGYLRVEKPLLGYDEFYGLVALLFGLSLAAGLLRWRRQGPEKPSGATR